MSFGIYKVEAYVKLDVEQIVDAILKMYSDISIEDITMDTIFEYVDGNITYLKEGTYRSKGIAEVDDGPSLEGFEEHDYEKIEEELERIKKERTKPDIVQYSFDMVDPIDEQGLVKILEDAGVKVVGSGFQYRWTDKEYWNGAKKV